MGINPINNISIIIRILFAVTLFQQPMLPKRGSEAGAGAGSGSAGAHFSKNGRERSVSGAFLYIYIKIYIYSKKNM
jgi:hypothetical protein